MYEGGVGVGVAFEEGTMLDDTTSMELESTTNGLDDATIELDTVTGEDDELEIMMLDEGADGIEEELGTTKSTDEALLYERAGELVVPSLHFPNPFWHVAASQ